MSKFKESLYVLVNAKKKRENVDTFFALFPERLVTGLDVLSIFHYTERDAVTNEGLTLLTLKVCKTKTVSPSSWV